MPRQARIQYEDALYHVMTRANSDQKLFLDEQDHRLLVGLLSNVYKRYNFHFFSYCLLSNHFHLLISTPAANLSQGMQYLNGVYAQAFNNRWGRYGHVMQGRYNPRLIEEEEYFCRVARYIALNPVKAGLAQAPEKWEFSSFNALIGLVRCPGFLKRDELLYHFGDRPMGKPVSFLSYLGAPDASDWELDEDSLLLLHSLTRIFTDKPKQNAIIDAVENWGYSLREVGDFLGIHKTTVFKLIHQSKR